MGWDGTCADIAGTDCHERCNGCGPSNCCGERDGPGCEDAACQACVCNVDNFCCDTGWDGSCVDIANANCPSTCLCSPSTCVGDCNGDGTVNISELIIAVNIALDSRPVGDCSVVDQNNDGQVTVNELILAVNAGAGRLLSNRTLDQGAAGGARRAATGWAALFCMRNIRSVTRCANCNLAWSSALR
jgi:hypothetical protein